MIKCTICKDIKEDSEFSMYYHSTFDKFYQRKQCKECYSKRRKEAKHRKKLKYCKTCDTYMSPTVFYGISPKTNKIKVLKNEPRRCESCRSIYNKKYNSKYYYQGKEKKLDPDNPMYLKVLPRPGKYVTEHQKEMTFEIMEALGWKHNPNNGVWWKKGYKTEEGKFTYNE